MTNTPRTLFQKVWDAHVAHEAPGEPSLLYIDLHLVHEVTSPQAFDGLRMAGRGVRRPDLTVATIDHGVPTANRSLGIRDPLSKRQIDALIQNCGEYGITLYGLGDPRQGIVHIIGPEQGLTQPGMTIVCGDSHTATHGAFGALAFGIGTSEVEHVLATQTLPQIKPKAMAVTVEGDLPTRRDGQGHHPRHHRQDRRSRRDRTCDRIPRLDDPLAVDGSPNDHLQHVDRRWRTRGDGCARRHHLLVSRRATVRTEGMG